MAKDKEQQVPYEEAMERLEAIVSRLERGDLSLDNSLEAFEEGSKLVAQCQTALKNAEMRVEKIMVKDGEKSNG